MVAKENITREFAWAVLEEEFRRNAREAIKWAAWLMEMEEVGLGREGAKRVIRELLGR